MPELHDPFMSQQPMHVVEQALAPSSPPALEASSPEEPPLSSPDGGMFKPGPVDVDIGGAASAAAPESCEVIDPIPMGASKMESSPRVPFPGAAQATRITRRNQPNPHVLGPDEPMRKTSGPFSRLVL